MRHIHEPLMMRKHAALLHNINEMSIDIKLFHIESEEKKAMPDEYAKAQANRRPPTWENVIELLSEAYKAIDEQKFNPVKY